MPRSGSKPAPAIGSLMLEIGCDVSRRRQATRRQPAGAEVHLAARADRHARHPTPADRHHVTPRCSLVHARASLAGGPAATRAGRPHDRSRHGRTGTEGVRPSAKENGSPFGLPAVPVSRPYLASVLRECRKNANMRSSSEVGNSRIRAFTTKPAPPLLSSEVFSIWGVPRLL